MVHFVDAKTLVNSAEGWTSTVGAPTHLLRSAQQMLHFTHPFEDARVSGTICFDIGMTIMKRDREYYLCGPRLAFPRSEGEVHTHVRGRLYEDVKGADARIAV